MFFGISLHNATLAGIARSGPNLMLIIKGAMRRVAKPCSSESQHVDGEWWDSCEGTVMLENVRTITVNGDPVHAIPMAGSQGEIQALDHSPDGGVAISIAWFDPRRGTGSVDHSLCTVDCDHARWIFGAPAVPPKGNG
jgi:hypothetical protein